MFTKKHNEETKKKISTSMKEYHQSLSEVQKQERRNKIKETFKRLYQENRY